MLLPAQPAIHDELLLEIPVAGQTVESLAVSPDGGHHAFVLHSPEVDTLYIDGESMHAADAIEQVSIDEAGKVTFWYRKGKRQYVVSGDEEAGPYDDIHMPDLEALGAQAYPSQDEWSYRGGSRTAFAARDREGRWSILLRFSAAPQAQEQRPLPTAVHMRTGPDPTVEAALPMRYGFVKGSVPVFIGKKGNVECLVVGDDKAGCGREVSMLAWSPVTGRLAFALRVAGGLLMHSGHQWHGPVKNVDWVSFSPDGHHLAFLVREGNQQVLMLDDEAGLRYPLIESLAWMEDGRLLVLGHDDDGAHLTLDRVPILDKPLISAVYVSPKGTTVVAGTDPKGFFLDPFANLPDVDSLWGEGFLADGRFYAIARLVGGGQALVFGDGVGKTYSVVKGYTTSPDGRHLAAVGGTVGESAVLLDGREVMKTDHVIQELHWCGNDRLLARERAGDEDCLVDGDGGRFCCPRMVVAQCSSQGVPRYLCMTGEGYVFYEGLKAIAQAYQEVPLHLVFKDDATGTLELAGRRGDQWYLSIDGKEQSADGKPLFVYPAGNEGWYLVEGPDGRRWVGPFGKSGWYDGIQAPVSVGGRSLFAVRRDGREAWVLPGREPRWSGPLASPPVAFAGGFLYLSHEGGFYHLRVMLIEGPDKQTEK